MLDALRSNPKTRTMELEISQLREELGLKKLESQCLVEICQRQATVISTQEKMSKLLEERLYQALNKFHPLQIRARTRRAA